MGTGGGAAAARAWRALWALAWISGRQDAMPAVLTSCDAYEPAPRMKAMPVHCARPIPTPTHPNTHLEAPPPLAQVVHRMC